MKRQEWEMTMAGPTGNEPGPNPTGVPYASSPIRPFRGVL